MTDNSLANEDTGSLDNNNQAQTNTPKTYTEDEVNDMMARMKGSLTKKLTKQYEDLGDPEELRTLKQDSERRKLDEQKKRGEFDRIIQELAEKKDQEIRKRDEIIRNYSIDVPLVNAAAQFRSVNPDQVKQLLKPSLRLNDNGEVEVLDDKGSVKYNDKGTPYRVDDLVKDFLNSNPHFVQAPPSTTQGRSNIGQAPEKLDLSKLNMKDANQRRMFKEAMSKK
jgi:hypothetical protein